MSDDKPLTEDNKDNAVAGSSVNKAEVQKFNGVCWWDQQNGTMKPLISFNKLRVPFIRDGILNSVTTSGTSTTDGRLDGFRILDLGCGGGILSEGLGQIGATVVGIDPGRENISIANKHLPVEMNGRVTYKNTTIEMYASHHPESSFDAVVMSEVIEHVENPKQFIGIATKLLKVKSKGSAYLQTYTVMLNIPCCYKPNGSLFISTPNRSIISWIGQILMGEYVLRILPVGTHQWKKFLTPKEVEEVLKTHGLHIVKLKGITYNPITNVWDWITFTQIHYALHAVKASK